MKFIECVNSGNNKLDLERSIILAAVTATNNVYRIISRMLIQRGFSIQNTQPWRFIMFYTYFYYATKKIDVSDFSACRQLKIEALK